MMIITKKDFTFFSFEIDIRDIRETFYSLNCMTIIFSRKLEILLYRVESSFNFLISVLPKLEIRSKIYFLKY